MKINYQLAAQILILIFSVVWAIAVLQSFFVAGFSIRMLQNLSFLLIMLGTLIIPIAAVWGLYFYFNK